MFFSENSELNFYKIIWIFFSNDLFNYSNFILIFFSIIRKKKLKIEKFSGFHDQLNWLTELKSLIGKEIWVLKKSVKIKKKPEKPIKNDDCKFLKNSPKPEFQFLQNIIYLKISLKFLKFFKIDFFCEISQKVLI